LAYANNPNQTPTRLPQKPLLLDPNLQSSGRTLHLHLETQNRIIFPHDKRISHCNALENHPRRLRRPGLWWIHDRNRKRRIQVLPTHGIWDPGWTLVIHPISISRLLCRPAPWTYVLALRVSTSLFNARVLLDIHPRSSGECPALNLIHLFPLRSGLEVHPAPPIRTKF